MNKQIKDFIGTDALKAVLFHSETAVVLICKAIGFRLQKNDTEVVTPNGSISWVFDVISEIYDDMNFVHEAEIAVIKKVGAGNYGKYLLNIIEDFCETTAIWTEAGLRNEWISAIATAPAEQRIAAMLTALSEVEK